jgi:hypothetical protein
MADCADELALEFDDQVRSLEQLVERRVLTRLQANALILVEERLERMSGTKNRSLWGFQALETAPEWKEVRELATAAVAALSSQA